MITLCGAICPCTAASRVYTSASLQTRFAAQSLVTIPQGLDGSVYEMRLDRSGDIPCLFMSM